MQKNIVIFGSTGMLGQALVIESLEDNRIGSILLINRKPSGVTNPKIKEIIHSDFYDFSAISHEFIGIDACFFCLGTSAVGKNEAKYHRITYDLTLEVATRLKGVAPEASFIYISGAGTDSSAKGRVMWARVKGKTENMLIDTFNQAYMFRPGYIQPAKGVVSSTNWYRWIYKCIGFLYPVIRRVFKNSVMTSEQLSHAMLNAAFKGYHRKIIEVRDVLNLAAAK